MTSLVSSTRKRSTCILGVMLPISSRNSVPPSAISKRPLRRNWAPVKAPRSCPNSSLSSRLSGSAPQLMGTMGKYLRWLLAWMVRATSSLPVPLSPRIITVALVCATWRISSITLCMAGLSPMTKSAEDSSSMVSRRWVFSSSSRRSLRARATRWLSSSGSMGLVT